MNSALSSSNYKKKDKKLGRAKGVMITAKKDSEGQLMKSKDIIGALLIPANDPMAPKDL